MRSIEVRRINQCLWGIGGICFLLHLIVLMSYSLNVPMWDEWNLLENHALARTLNIRWLFDFHNEHRIVLTRLQTWLLYRAGGWNINVNIMLNFFMYSAFCFLLLKTLQEKFDTPSGFILVLMSSTLPWYNHYYPFQSQFHYMLIFFFLAVMTAVSYSAWNNLSAAFAILSAYSVSSGIMCAAVCIGLLLVLAYMRPSMRFRYIVQAVVVGIAIVFWFSGFQKNPGHPPLIMPWDGFFWRHFLNVISTGFGYESVDMLPGALLLALIAALCIWRAMTLGRLPEDKKGDYIAVIAFVLGILASVASISTARASFGPLQAKASRYAEFSGMLIPCLWVFFVAASRKLPGLPGMVMQVAMLLIIVIPFHNEFGWKKVYVEEFQKKLAAHHCVSDYYLGKGEGDCSMTYLESIRGKLDRARELGLSFYREQR